MSLPTAPAKYFSDYFKLKEVISNNNNRYSVLLFKVSCKFLYSMEWLARLFPDFHRFNIMILDFCIPNGF